MKKQILDALEKSAVGQSFYRDRRLRTVLFAFLNMGWNLIYGIFNGALGILYRSGWFYTMFAYYALLGLMRLYVVSLERKPAGKKDERKALLLCGTGTVLLAVVLSLIVLLTIADSVHKRYHMVVMIAVAAFTFFTVIKAVVNAVQAQRHGDRLFVILRNLSCAAAVGSILSLQRSMLGTFGSGTERFTYVMDGLSGLSGFLIVAGIGISMIVQAVRLRRGD